MGETLAALWLILIGVWLGFSINALINILARDLELAEFIQWCVILLFGFMTFIIMIIC